MVWVSVLSSGRGEERAAAADVPELVSEGPAAVLGDIHGCASALSELATKEFVSELPDGEPANVGRA